MSEESFSNFNLKHKWVLWFHKSNDDNWGVDSYEKILDLSSYHDVLFMLKQINNINCGMFFLMKENIKPIYEDPKNKNGGYWSMRITKKDSEVFWKKIVYYLCIDQITDTPKNELLINGLSISPKVNNNIFKIWNSDYKYINKKCIRNDLDFIQVDDLFFLEHKENK